MPNTYTFTRIILKADAQGRIVSCPWWVNIVKWIARNPGHTSRECRFEICREVRSGKWDRFATNVWAALVKQKFIHPIRQGHSIVYYCTNDGYILFEHIMEVFAKRCVNI